MINIKNYYDQQQELNAALLRLKSLEEKREIYFENTQPKAVSVKDEIPGTIHTDLLTEYVIKIEKIDKDIELLKREIKISKKYLDKIEDCLRKMKDPLAKIFVARYIDGLSVNQMTYRINYSPSDIYRKLAIIRKIIQIDKK